MKCKQCGKDYQLENVHFPGFCSNKCYEEWKKWHNEPNCTCPVCGSKFYIKPSRLAKSKHSPCCSLACSKIYRSEWFSGKNNHQYGLKGDLNSSFVSDKRISNYGYVLIRKLDHPFKNSDDMVFEHRLVVEENSKLYDDKYFMTISGNKYLRPEYVVHHKNHIRTDNRIENLEIMLKGDHSRIHNLENPRERDVLGRFI